MYENICGSILQHVVWAWMKSRQTIVINRGGIMSLKAHIPCQAYSYARYILLLGWGAFVGVNIWLALNCRALYLLHLPADTRSNTFSGGEHCKKIRTLGKMMRSGLYTTWTTVIYGVVGVCTLLCLFVKAPSWIAIRRRSGAPSLNRCQSSLWAKQNYTLYHVRQRTWCVRQNWIF